MNERNPGVQLGHYLDDHPEVDVTLSCSNCGRSRMLPMASVVKRLAARGCDPRRTGICEIADLVQEACRCGVRKWETRPHWPQPQMGASREESTHRIDEMNDVAASYRAAKGR